MFLFPSFIICIVYTQYIVSHIRANARELLKRTKPHRKVLHLYFTIFAIVNVLLITTTHPAQPTAERKRAARYDCPAVVVAYIVLIYIVIILRAVIVHQFINNFPLAWQLLIVPGRDVATRLHSVGLRGFDSFSVINNLLIIAKISK